MNRFMLKTKIHRAKITHADIHYEGSLTIDATLMEAADILPFEKVCVWNVTRGTRLETYAIEGEADSGVLCANGAAAHLNQPGDIIIITTFTMLDESKARLHEPRVLFVDESNQIRQPVNGKRAAEIAGPKTRPSFDA